jgi:hypothetical protein
MGRSCTYALAGESSFLMQMRLLWGRGSHSEDDHSTFVIPDRSSSDPLEGDTTWRA